MPRLKRGMTARKHGSMLSRSESLAIRLNASSRVVFGPGGQERQGKIRNGIEQAAQDEPGSRRAAPLRRVVRGVAPAHIDEGQIQQCGKDQSKHGGTCRCVLPSIDDWARGVPPGASGPSFTL